MERGRRGHEDADQRAEGWLLSWLARRDYSVSEAANRLMRKGVTEARVQEVMEKFVSDGTISDRRFAETLVRSRAARGKGPLLVMAELKSRGVDRDVAREVADTQAWREVGEVAKKKRFGEAMPANSDEFDRQARFLAGRGFPLDMIFSLLGR